MALAFTPLTGVGNNTGGTSQSTAPQTTPAGPFLALVVILQSDTITSVTDNKGNTYTKTWESAGDPQDGSKVALFSCNNAVGGSGHVFTMNGGVAYATLMPAYCTGHDTSSPFLTAPVVQGTGTGNSLALSQPTLAQANCLLLFPILVNASINNPGMNPPSGFSSWFTQPDWNYWTGYASYLITSATTAATRTATGTGWVATTGGIVGVKEASGGGVTTTLAVTDTSDTVAATTSVTIVASLARPDAADVLSCAAAATVSATLSRTDFADTAASASAVRIVASHSAADASDALSSAAVVGAATVDCALAATDDPDAVTSSVAVAIGATLSRADAADSLGSSATVAVVAALSKTDAADALSAFAVIGTPPVTVDLAVVDVSDAVAGSASVRISSALGVSDADDAFASAAVARLLATLTVTDAADLLDAQASTVGVLLVNLAATDAADALAAYVVTSGPPVIGSILGRTREAYGIRTSVQTSTRRNSQSSRR